MKSKAKKQADARYIKSHIKRVPLDMQKTYFEDVLKPAADNAGETVNGYIKKAIAERIRREQDVLGS